MKKITVADLLSEDYLKERAGLIKHDQAVDFKAGAPKSGGTVYLTAADQDGMMVSFIQSNYAGFGSGSAYQEPVYICRIGEQGSLLILKVRMLSGQRKDHFIRSYQLF